MVVQYFPLAMLQKVVKLQFWFLMACFLSESRQKFEHVQKSLFICFSETLIYLFCFAFFNKCCVQKCWGRWITRFHADACSQSCYSECTIWETHALRNKTDCKCFPKQALKIYSRNQHSPPSHQGLPTKANSIPILFSVPHILFVFQFYFQFLIFFFFSTYYLTAEPHGSVIEHRQLFWSKKYTLSEFYANIYKDVLQSTET